MLSERLCAAVKLPSTHNGRQPFDRLIVETALPAMGNLAIVPFVSSMETMWIGNAGDTASLAGQSAASSAYLTSFFLISLLGHSLRLIRSSHQTSKQSSYI